ncbi:lipid asymmetry maintenance protein MlaB [Methylomonas koyamae]|jgi:Predicted NTP binding protein (contains STAS domain)|uniref:Anti-anti-sigma factor n=1 Tax=Methylomonas koyamae TaxID=702114 RepID=A0AA91I553_9GAMM|nr:STAS domain-containing protein [Methylomonas koyamae]OAI25776.1 anti-anti-sigma factor [Methylomonas koyamae]
MSKLALIEQASGYYTLEGSLTFASINKQTPKSFRLLKGMDSMCIDLSHVKATDSAGLALMIEWVRLSRMSRVQLRFENIPDQLLALAKLSGFNEIEYFTSAK